MFTDYGLSAILPFLLFTLPYLLIYLIGIVLAIVWMKKHPQVSMLAIIAFILFGISSITGAVTNFLPLLLRDTYGYSYSTIGNIQLVINIIHLIIGVCGWILILLAIFGWRKKSHNEPAPIIDHTPMEEAQKILGQS